MWTHCLYGIQIQLGVEEHVNDEVTTFGMVKEHKQAPVDQPGTLLQWQESTAKSLKKNYNIISMAFR